MGASMVKTALGAMEPCRAEAVVEAAGVLRQQVVLEAGFMELARRTRRGACERAGDER